VPPHMYNKSRLLSSHPFQFIIYKGADEFLARPGRKQATAIEDFDVRISYLLS